MDPFLKAVDLYLGAGKLGELYWKSDACIVTGILGCLIVFSSLVSLYKIPAALQKCSILWNN